MLKLNPFKLPAPPAAVTARAGDARVRTRGWRIVNGGWHELLRATLYPFSAFAFALILVGCASSPDGKDQLEQGYADLEKRQYDAAISKADAFLASNSTGGSGSAEALYLRGRALEQKTAANPHESRQNLQSARSAYLDALNHNPSPELEARVRASLANVAYFQDDYATALNEWKTAYEGLENADTRAWVLYRMGLCHQRLGHFKEADAAFANVIKQYPSTTPARRAKEHQGATAFFVQLGTFNSAAGADRATEEVRKQGVTPSRATDAQGRHLLRVGPLTSYGQAQAVKSKFTGTYPDAIIVP